MLTVELGLLGSEMIEAWSRREGVLFEYYKGTRPDIPWGLCSPSFSSFSLLLETYWSFSNTHFCLLWGNRPATVVKNKLKLNVYCGVQWLFSSPSLWMHEWSLLTLLSSKLQPKRQEDMLLWICLLCQEGFLLLNLKSQVSSTEAAKWPGIHSKRHVWLLADID